jgi:hypothetical protein
MNLCRETVNQGPIEQHMHVVMLRQALEVNCTGVRVVGLVLSKLHLEQELGQVVVTDRAGQEQVLFE